MIIAMVVVLPAPLPPSSPVIEPPLERERDAVDRAGGLVDLDQLVDGDGGHGGQRIGRRLEHARRCDLARGLAQAPLAIAGPSATFERGAAKDYIHAMADQPAREARPTGRNVRLDTLVRLRWLAVIGQTTAVLVVYVGLDYELPIWACLAVIALAAWLNVALRVRFPMTQRLEPDRAAWLLAFDIAELAVLLFFTGGLQNPFAFLLLGPVLLSATALPPRMTLMLGGFAIALRHRADLRALPAALGHRRRRWCCRRST